MDDSSEDADEIDEQVERVGDEVFVAHAAFLDDGLRVVQDEADHHAETDEDLKVVDDPGADEDVSESGNHHVEHDVHNRSRQE